MNKADTVNGSENLFGSRRQLAKMALCVLIALKIGFLFLFAWHSRFVMDEFVQLGWAKYLGHGLFDTVWHPKAVGYVVFYKLAHLIGWDATSILLIGRIQTALLACGILAIVYGCARALGNDRLRSLAILVVLLCFSNFIERSFRTIAEPLAVVFGAMALLVVLRGRTDKPWTIIGAGMLGGLAFLATQKALYFDLALGLALVADAALARHYRDGIVRGLWLVLGWALPIILYCFIFGGADPIPIAMNLAFGPIEIATTGADAYGSLRQYVTQTLLRNAMLYLFCFGGMILELRRIRRLDEPRRIALIFTIIVSALVFAHNQPWPYVFIMALPFMALWSMVPFDRIAADRARVRLAGFALGLAVALSFIRNVQYLQIDNRAQLDLVKRAESLVGPNDVYFDGVGMLPNRAEPSTLWLDRAHVLQARRQKHEAEVYRIFADDPPKVILWTYRMDAIIPVVGPLVRNSYVSVGPNLRLAGSRLNRDQPVTFDVPIAGTYATYDQRGQPLQTKVEIDGKLLAPPFHIPRGARTMVLRSGPEAALLLPQGSYIGRLEPGRDNRQLFDDVYN